MATMKKVSDEDDGADLPEAWERGVPIELRVSPRATGVLSIRIPRDLSRKLDARARREGKPSSVLARELIEQGLLAEGPSTPRELAKLFERWLAEWERSTKTSKKQRRA